MYFSCTFFQMLLEDGFYQIKVINNDDNNNKNTVRYMIQEMGAQTHTQKKKIQICFEYFIFEIL